MPIQNIEEVSVSYPFVTEIKKVISFSDFEVIEADGERKLKMYLDFTNFQLTYDSQKNYGNNFENLPTDIRSCLDEIEYVDVKCYLQNENNIKETFRKISNLLPKVRHLGIDNEKPTTFPQRYFDDNLEQKLFDNLTKLNYPQRTIETFPHEHYEHLKQAISSLQHDGIKVALKFNEETNTDAVELELTEEQLSKIEMPPSLFRASFFASVTKLTFRANFQDPEAFQEQLSTLTKLFQNVEDLAIDKIHVNLESMLINQSFDFSQLANLKKLRSLQFPVTATSDYHFLNDMENLSELDLAATVGYGVREYSPTVENFISHISDAKSEQIRKLTITHCPSLTQEVFDRLCNQFDAVEDLHINTIKYDILDPQERHRDVAEPLVENFDSLSRLQNLRKLHIDNLALLEGHSLERLTELKIDNPTSLTLDNFSRTSEKLENLNKLSVHSAYNNGQRISAESWNIFFKGASNLHGLNKMNIYRILKVEHRDNDSQNSWNSRIYSNVPTVEIDETIIDHLTKTKITKLDLSGFKPSPDLSINYKHNSDKKDTAWCSEEILELIEERRSKQTPSSAITAEACITFQEKDLSRS